MVYIAMVYSMAEKLLQLVVLVGVQLLGGGGVGFVPLFSSCATLGAYQAKMSVVTQMKNKKKHCRNTYQATPCDC